MKKVLCGILAVIAGLAAGILISAQIGDGILPWPLRSTAVSATAAQAESETNEKIPLSDDFSVPAESDETDSMDTTVQLVALQDESGYSEQQTLLEQAYQCVYAFRDQDYSALASLVHPLKGVTFTPYSTVDPVANLVFTAEEIQTAASNAATYIWGLWDGTGDPIQMTMMDYFNTFVYNADYASAPMIGIDRILASGNCTENAADAYPDGHFVEFHFPELDPDNEGFDWCSLRLVFEQYREEYKLVGVIHSQWTI